MATHLFKGTTLSVDNSGGTPQIIGNVTSVDGLSEALNEINITSSASTAMEYRAGRRKYGQVTFEINQDPASVGQAELTSIQGSGATREFILTMPTGTLNVITFNGWVVSYSLAAEDDDIVRRTLVVQVTGAPSIV